METLALAWSIRPVPPQSTVVMAEPAPATTTLRNEFAPQFGGPYSPAASWTSVVSPGGVAALLTWFTAYARVAQGAPIGPQEALSSPAPDT
jgi:hypothetical protein